MTYDLAVVGSGPGGYKAAVTAANLGARVALIDAGVLGGTCLNRGCIPKKALHHQAALLDEFRSLQGRGLEGEVHLDLAAARAHKEQVVTTIRNGLTTWLRRNPVDLYTSRARLTGAGSLTLDDGTSLEAGRIVLATGSRPRDLPECPVDGDRVLSSDHFLDGPAPAAGRYLCVGGGPVNAELAYVLRQFGAEVTLITRGERLLPGDRLPERAGQALGRRFRRMGLDVRPDTTVAASRHVDGGVAVTLSDGEETVFDRVLVAVGRQPSSEGLGLEEAGVAVTPGGFVRTNEYLETTLPGVYAVGDVKPGAMNANAALQEGKVAARNALEGNSERPHPDRVPTVIYSALEIAAVGLSEERAEAAGFEPVTALGSFGASPKAHAHGASEGFVEVVLDEETGQLLGGCIVGPEAGEQIHLLGAACQSSRGLNFLSELCYSHPSWCEELENAVDPFTWEFRRAGLAQPGLFANLG